MPNNASEYIWAVLFEMLDKNNGNKRESFAKLILDIMYAEKDRLALR
jgi:hypothetical protein